MERYADALLEAVRDTEYTAVQVRRAAAQTLATFPESSILSVVHRKDDRRMCIVLYLFPPASTQS